jgi:transposase
VTDLESGKPLSQIAREYGIHPGLPSRWRDESVENPETAFIGNGNKYKDKARVAELERLGKAHAKERTLKKALAMTAKKVREERRKPSP